MGSRPTVGHYQFDAWDLPTKYGWMHSGPGAKTGTEVQQLVNQMAERLAVSGERVGRLLTGAEWMGAAAEAAARAMQRGAGQITQTAAGTATGEHCITELSESFQAAQHRVPSPNEIPSGLGDRFLFRAAEGLNALSPFDVQSPLHEAMARRRELEEQANQALTEHMTASRDRVEAMPVVAAPAPMTVAAQSTAIPGVGGVGQPGWGVPAATATGSSGAPAPATTPPAALPGPVPVQTPTSPPSPGSGGTQVRPDTPVSTRPAQTTPGRRFSPPPSGPPTTAAAAAEPGAGGGAFGPRFGAQPGAGATGARGGRFGARPGVSGEAMPGRAAPGPGGQADGAAPAQRGGGAGGTGSASGAAGRSGAGSFLQPAVGSRGSGDDAEHKDRYARHADHIVGELPLVAPAVIGETPEEEDLRLRRVRDSG